MMKIFLSETDFVFMNQMINLYINSSNCEKPERQSLVGNHLSFYDNSIKYFRPTLHNFRKHEIMLRYEFRYKVKVVNPLIF
jgi:hypothetical protein